MRPVTSVILSLIGLCCTANAQQLAPTCPKPIGIASVDKRPTKTVKPMYPVEAKKAGIEGSVVLDIVINEGGGVCSAEAVNGPKELVPAAVAAVKQWRWEPFLLNGKPQAIRTKATVQFVLHKGESVNGEMAALPLPCEYAGAVERTEQGQIVRYLSDEFKSKATHKVDITGAIKQADIKGTAIVDVLVGPEGKVICAKTLYGHPMFRKPVEDALSAWRFKPETQAGKAVAYLGRLEFFLCNINCGKRGTSMTILN